MVRINNFSALYPAKKLFCFQSIVMKLLSNNWEETFDKCKGQSPLHLLKMLRWCVAYVYRTMKWNQTLDFFRYFLLTVDHRTEPLWFNRKTIFWKPNFN